MKRKAKSACRPEEDSTQKVGVEADKTTKEITPNTEQLYNSPNKTKYEFDFRMLEFNPRYGLKVTKVHCIFRLMQSPW